jgi:hypothetical protein
MKQGKRTKKIITSNRRDSSKVKLLNALTLIIFFAFQFCDVFLRLNNFASLRFISRNAASLMVSAARLLRFFFFLAITSTS